MFERLLVLSAIGGGVWWAYSQGYADTILAALRGSGAAQGGQEAGEGVQAPAPAPAASLAGVSGDTPEMRLLLENLDVVQPWARSNLEWVAALIRQESGGRLGAVSGAGATGAMQVMPNTAKDVYRWGWRDFQPTRSVLRTGAGSVYFGTAYLEHLSRRAPQMLPKSQMAQTVRDWVTYAYHGGPDGEFNGSWGPITREYLPKIRRHYFNMTGKMEA